MHDVPLRGIDPWGDDEWVLLRSQVEDFLLASVDSVEQCEILVTMRTSMERWWTAVDLARELYLSEVPTSQDLETLATRGLLEVRSAADLRYRIALLSADLTKAVDELADAYRTNRMDVLNYIVRRKGRALKHFADAFNFRRSRE